MPPPRRLPQRTPAPATLPRAGLGHATGAGAAERTAAATAALQPGVIIERGCRGGAPVRGRPTRARRRDDVEGSGDSTPRRRLTRSPTTETRVAVPCEGEMGRERLQANERSGTCSCRSRRSSGASVRNPTPTMTRPFSRRTCPLTFVRIVMSPSWAMPGATVRCSDPMSSSRPRRRAHDGEVEAHVDHSARAPRRLPVEPIGRQRVPVVSPRVSLFGDRHGHFLRCSALLELSAGGRTPCTGKSESQEAETEESARRCRPSAAPRWCPADRCRSSPRR